MRRHALMLLAFTLVTSCVDIAVGSDPPDTPERLFQIVWEDFDRNYALFADRNVDWNAVRAQYQVQADAAEPDIPIAGVIAAMLRELRDPHVDLHLPDRVFHSVDPSASRTFFSLITVTARYVLPSAISPSGNMRYGRISAEIGYVYIGSFGGRGWEHEIDAVLASFATAHTVIIDIRNNGGGSSNTAEAIAGRFVERERLFAHIRWRDGPAHDDLTDFIPLRIKPVGPRFTGNVIVLTNRKAVSASEHFVLALRGQSGVLIVGDTTAGGFGNPMIRELPNGWTYRLPQWAEYDAQRVSHEGIGLVPDIVVPLTFGDSAGLVDRQLESAVQEAVRAAASRR
jgi:carboxyl-terminal processing protease